MCECVDVCMFSCDSVFMCIMYLYMCECLGVNVYVCL